MRTHPCVGRCSHSVSDGPCRGCGRSIEEVRDWNTYTPEAKAALMVELVDRRACVLTTPGAPTMGQSA